MATSAPRDSHMSAMFVRPSAPAISRRQQTHTEVFGPRLGHNASANVLSSVVAGVQIVYAMRSPPTPVVVAIAFVQGVHGMQIPAVSVVLVVPVALVLLVVLLVQVAPATP